MMFRAHHELSGLPRRPSCQCPAIRSRLHGVQGCSAENWFWRSPGEATVQASSGICHVSELATSLVTRIAEGVEDVEIGKQVLRQSTAPTRRQDAEGRKALFRSPYTVLLVFHCRAESTD